MRNIKRMSMKRFVLPVGFVLGSSVVLAQGMMDSDYGMMGGSLGWSLVWLLYFALASFIFSVVFWLTRRWIGKK